MSKVERVFPVYRTQFGSPRTPYPVSQRNFAKNFGASGLDSSSPLDIFDRIDGMLRGSIAAKAGLQSDTWRSILSDHPDLHDPFTVIVDAAPAMADEAATLFTYNIIARLKDSGLPESDLVKEISRLSSGMEQYYSFADADGNPCSYDSRTGEFQSSRTGASNCLVTKVAGGGVDLIKRLVADALASQSASIRNAYKGALRGATNDLMAHPRKIWSNLNSASRVLLMASALGAGASGAGASGAGASAAIPDNFSWDRKAKDFYLKIPKVGTVRVEGGELQALSLYIPTIKVRSLSIRAGGEGSRLTGRGSGTVTATVPVRDVNLSAEVARRVAEGEGTTSSVSTTIANEGGTKAFTASVSKSRTPTRTDTSLRVGGRLAAAKLPNSRIRDAYVNAGVGANVNSRGQLVEPSASIQAGFKFGAIEPHSEAMWGAYGSLAAYLYLIFSDQVGS